MLLTQLPDLLVIKYCVMKISSTLFRQMFGILLADINGGLAFVWFTLIVATYTNPPSRLVIFTSQLQTILSQYKGNVCDSFFICIGTKC